MENPDDVLIARLAADNWVAIEQFFPSAMTSALLDDLKAQQNQTAFKRAGTGKGHASSIGAEQVRTDTTLWLDGSTPAQRDYLGRMEDLRLTLNRALFLGLFDYECHYAVYAPGGFYKKHIDSLHGVRNRIVSCVTYLTPDWTEADGGHLALYDPADDRREIARILPRAGTLAMFFSEEIPHEVLPPARDRASIAGWFRCNPSQAGRIDPPR